MIHHVGASEPVRFELAGKEYTLRFTLGALKALAEKHDIKVMRGGDQMIDAVRDPAKLALIMYHGLLPNHPDITVEWVENNFDSGMLADLAPVVGHAMSGKSNALPNVESPSNKANGIGLLSGQSDATISDSPNATSGN